jgi:hypothetical protein
MGDFLSLIMAVLLLFYVTENNQIKSELKTLEFQCQTKQENR